MLVIFANCVSLALYNPLEAEDGPHNVVLKQLGEGWRQPAIVHRMPVVGARGASSARLRPG